MFISTLQGVVLGMGLWFKWQKRGQVDDDDDEEGEGEEEGGEQRQADEERRGRDSVRSGDEQTPLLRSGN